MTIGSGKMKFLGKNDEKTLACGNRIQLSSWLRDLLHHEGKIAAQGRAEKLLLVRSRSLLASKLI
jgi:hypothetical protein